MRKRCCLFLLFLAALPLPAAGADSSVYREMISAYQGGFYPGAAAMAERLESEFPGSPYIGNALVLKGECLARIGQFGAALAALEKAEAFAEGDPALSPAFFYWKGFACGRTAAYGDALSAYYECCRASGEGGTYYAPAVLDAGRVCFAQDEWAAAVPLFEYAVTHGQRYGMTDYADAVLKLARSYIGSGNPEKAYSLFQKFSQDDLPARDYYLLAGIAGDACLDSGRFREAYDLYCLVLASGRKELVSGALKKAYAVSAAHRAETGEDPGAVLKKAQDSFSDSPELLSEFWIRLGTDAFFAGDTEKAAAYFDEAETGASPEMLELTALYRAEIAAGKNPSAESAAAAEAVLLDARRRCGLSDGGRYARQYDSLSAKYAAAQGRWDDVKKYAAKVSAAGDDLKYLLALADYRTGFFSEAAALLDGGDSVLYALSLARIGRFEDAAAAFERADSRAPLDGNARLDYAAVLLHAGRYADALAQASSCGGGRASYVAALAQFGTGAWREAEQSFSEFLESGAADRESLPYARFYRGYCLYRLGRLREAYGELSAFSETWPSHEAAWRAAVTAANAAVQDGRGGDALPQAEKAVRLAPDGAAREESVLLCAEIYADSGAYDKAVALLSPYTRLRNDFGAKSLYQTARIYERQNLVEKADAEYKRLASAFRGRELAEEALYRRGELYYTRRQYGAALERFNGYTAEYPDGRFADAAWYFSACCLSAGGETDLAILRDQSLVKSFPDSAFVYSAAKDLVELYGAAGKYQEAYDSARFLLEKYGEQARRDGIEKKAAGLRRLAAGDSADIAAKLTEYESAGGSDTRAGRAAGTELAALYAASPSSAADGERLAERLLAEQKKNIPAESLYAARNAFLLGGRYRLAGRNEAAAQMYLLAAEYYRMNGQDGQGAASLYGAADAFRAAGLAGDASETAATLRALYPESREAKSLDLSR